MCDTVKVITPDGKEFHASGVAMVNLMKSAALEFKRDGDAARAELDTIRAALDAAGVEHSGRTQAERVTEYVEQLRRTRRSYVKCAKERKELRARITQLEAQREADAAAYVDALQRAREAERGLRELREAAMRKRFYDDRTVDSDDC